MERPENFYFDTRIRRRTVARGLISSEQVASYLDALPDQTANSAVIDIAQPAVSPPPAPSTPPPVEASLAAVSPFSPPAAGSFGAGPGEAPVTMQSATTTRDEDWGEPPPTPVMLSAADLAAVAPPQSEETEAAPVTPPVAPPAGAPVATEAAAPQAAPEPAAQAAPEPAAPRAEPPQAQATPAEQAPTDAGSSNQEASSSEPEPEGTP